MLQITQVVPQADHTLAVELSNGHRIIYDMRPRLGTARFHSLSDLNKFCSVRIEQGNTLVWDDLCQVTIDEILDMVGR